jgi:hypothetical protein
LEIKGIKGQLGVILGALLRWVREIIFIKIKCGFNCANWGMGDKCKGEIILNYFN